MPGGDTLHRRSIRLPGYDYAQPGAYFVTMLTAGRQCLFGRVVDQEMRLSALGKIVEEEWLRTPMIRAEIALGAYVVMPNHFHAIVVISSEAPSGASDVRATGGSVGATGGSPVRAGGSPLRPRGPAPRSLGALIAGFKSSVTKRINALRDSPNAPIWQRNYYEHIIRNQREGERIHLYIDSNPVRWSQDQVDPSYCP
ncbi:MAG TPA: hypothetical protein VF784_17660 [Anaerolineales bacterium]